MATFWFKVPPAPPRRAKEMNKSCSLVLFWQRHHLLSVSLHHMLLSAFFSSSLSDMLDHPSPSPPLNPLWLVCSRDKEQGWKDRERK